MTNQQNQSGNSSSSRIPKNASEAQASQIVGYSIGDVVKLGDTITSDVSNGGTSTGNTPNSTFSPGMITPGSDMANINAGHSSGNSAGIPQDSHQAAMSNAAEGQHFQVSRYDASLGLFWAYKLNSDGSKDTIEVPLSSDDNYELVSGSQRG